MKEIVLRVFSARCRGNLRFAAKSFSTCVSPLTPRAQAGSRHLEIFLVSFIRQARAERRESLAKCLRRVGDDLLRLAIFLADITQNYVSATSSAR